jgi:hypothetical protein
MFMSSNTLSEYETERKRKSERERETERQRQTERDSMRELELTTIIKNIIPFGGNI